MKRQVLHEPGKNAHTDSYMWLYRTSGDTDRHIVLYEYQPNRKAEHPKEFLKDFSGYLHTDGYKGYHTLPENIRGVGCWAHARRCFDEAMKVIPVSERKTSHAHKGRSTCNQLFANTPGGAQGSAIIFSMIETAKENGLDPYKYLLHSPCSSHHSGWKHPDHLYDAPSGT